MPTGSNPSSSSLVVSLKPFLLTRKAELTVGEMVARVEIADGPGPVLFVLTLPVLIPLPPGVSMLFALPLLIIAPQIMIGRRRLWLPKALSRRTIKRAQLVKVIRRVLPPLKRVEKIVRPRMTFLTGPTGARAVGLACTVIAVVLVLPLPFANLVPSLALGMFSLGLTRKDGLLVLAGYGLLIAAAGVIYLGVHGATVGLSHLRALI